MNAKVSATKVCPGCSARYPPDALFCPNDGSPLTAAPFGSRESDSGPHGSGEEHDSYLGREISGHIEIRNLAGVGAMGRVYRAFQKGIDRDVAVKVLHRELSANQQLVARFHREAKVASRLQHPNVVQVHLAGQLPDGAMYIVMEYLDGLSLQSALSAAGGPLPLQRALHIALQICDAAGEAHSQGVVHRDIKPENVMLIRRGEDADFVKVLDFGIARLNWGEQSMATAAGLIFGTARYISPEGAQGEAVGPEGDVYATATLLYQMLAGRTPFEGEQAVALLVQQIHDAPPNIRTLPGGRNVPEALAAVLMQNLSKNPADRAPDGRTFGRSLVEAAKAVGLSPEDLVPRSSLFVPPARLSEATSLGGPPEADKQGGSRANDARSPARAIVPPVDPMTAPPGAKTQKWNPAGSSPSISVLPPRGVEGTASSRRGVPSDPFGPATVPDGPEKTSYDAFPPPARPYSSVDTTLDDASAVRAPAASSPRIRTEPAIPLQLGMPTETPPPPQVHPPPMPPNASLGALGATLDDHGSNVRQAPPALMVQAPRRGRPRLITVVVVCFLFGMIGALFGLYQLGFVGTGVRSGSLDDTVAHADDALKHSRWDDPPGDNVRDLTNAGLAKWPRDPRLLDLRARATDELVKEAVGRKFAGDVPGALHLTRLANELDPTDTTAQHLVEEYERLAKKPDAAPAGSTAPTVTPAAHPSHPTGGTVAKVALEASLPHPKVGQPVTFTAKVSANPMPPKGIEEPRFVINGPGLSPDTKLGLVPQAAGIYQATFAGFEPGKYDVTFDAKADATVVHATRSIVVEADGKPGGTTSPTVPPPPPSSNAPSLPSSVPSGKWL